MRTIDPSKVLLFATDGRKVWVVKEGGKVSVGMVNDRNRKLLVKMLGERERKRDA